MRLIRRSSAALLGAILVLSTFAIAPVVASGLTTHFTITGLNDPAAAGVADASVTVTALTAGNTTDTAFAGTVSFTSSDGTAILPANGSTLTSGVGTFSVTLKLAGLQTVTVKDDADAATGTASATVTPGPATHFAVGGFPDPVTAGTAGGVDVSAIDAYNNVATSYNGTIHFTSSDPIATLPANTPAVNGQVSFVNSFTLKTAGSQSITATDTVTASITGSQVAIDVNPAAATHLSVTGYPSPTVAGVSHNATVTALDAFNNTATGYTGTVHVTSSDVAATLPANHTYTSGLGLENGVHNFAVTLNTAGAGRTITATDTVTASITGTSAGITVTNANVAPVAVNDSASVTVNAGFTAINVLANDTDGNLDPLHVASATQPTHGTVVIPVGGANVTYKPNAGFVGTDTFTYKANDGTVDSNSATVTVHVGADATKPVVTAPFQTITSQIVGTTTVKVHFTWTGSDVGLGIKNYEFWQSTDGGAFVKVKTTTDQFANIQMTRNHTYRLRVRAIDKAGNIGAFATGPTLRFTRYEETSATYPLAWTTVNSTVYSSGHAKFTNVAGHSASLRTTARTFTWIGVRGPTRGTADVYMDGVLVKHVSLFSTVRSYGRVIFSISFATLASHQINIVYTGLTNRRIDLDQIIVLR